MSIPLIEQLHKHLTADVKKLGSESVLNDPIRKIFSTRINGAIFEFGHKQADPEYWSGVKHYGSGPSSRFRVRRSLSTPVASDATPNAVKAAKPARKSSKSKLAAV